MKELKYFIVFIITISSVGVVSGGVDFIVTDKGIAPILTDYVSDGGNNTSLWNQSGSDIYYNTGNVGIGTTTPDNKFHIMDSDASLSSHVDTIMTLERNGHSQFEFLNPNDKTASIFFSDGTAGVGRIEYSHSANTMKFWTGRDDRVDINSVGKVTINDGDLYIAAGKLGVNYPSPDTPLQVNYVNGRMVRFGTSVEGIDFYHDTSSGASYIDNVYNGASASLIFRTATRYGVTGKERMTITYTGKIGIGTTTPTADLDVSGNVNISGNLIVQGCIQYNCSGTCVTLGDCV